MVKLDLVKMKCLATSKSITVRCTPNNRKYGREEKRIERKEKREAKKELKSSGGKRTERAKF